MVQLHERTMVERRAGSVLAHVLIDWCSRRVNVWTWQRAVKALLDVERRCLFEAMGEGDVATYVFDGVDALDVWEVVERWQREHGVTWLEAARVLHSEIAPMLNYALRSERHPDDPTGEQKADEA